MVVFFLDLRSNNNDESDNRGLVLDSMMLLSVCFSMARSPNWSVIAHFNAWWNQTFKIPIYTDNI